MEWLFACGFSGAIIGLWAGSDGAERNAKQRGERDDAKSAQVDNVGDPLQIEWTEQELACYRAAWEACEVECLGRIDNSPFEGVDNFVSSVAAGYAVGREVSRCTKSCVQPKWAEWNYDCSE